MNYRTTLLRNDIKKLKAQEELSLKEKNKQIKELKKELKAWEKADFLKQINELKKLQNEQLRKINLLFDEKAKDYSFIDFNGLYSLLSQIAEREREREQK